MILNVISLIIFGLSLFFGKLLAKTKHGFVILRTLSFLVFSYKTIFYIYQNALGNTCIPVEISSLSYFLVSFIIAFKITKFYNIASFFGTSAGLGFFFFYIFAGNFLRSNFLITDFIFSSLFHGFLLSCGTYLLEKNNFKNTNKLSIWVTILAMIAWALIFYEVESRGLTFVYFIIKPTYLLIFNSLSLNILCMLIFYALIISLFYLWTKIFYFLNKKFKLFKC